MQKLISFLLLSLFFGCSSSNTENKLPEFEEADLLSKPSTEKKDTTQTLALSYVDTFPLPYLTGQFDPAKHEAFELIAIQYADRKGMYIRKDTYKAFKAMHAAALEDGIKLVIRSATRNFQSQKGIWEAKWVGTRKIENGTNAQTAYPDPVQRALKILEYSSMPGTSRHHWGTDLDFNAFTNEYFMKGEGLKVYNWLLENAASFGFCQPYTQKGSDRPDGYNEERWHWSYMPVSLGLTLQAKAQLKNEQIQGFKGAETAPKINVVQKYVLGINQDCLN